MKKLAVIPLLFIILILVIVLFPITTDNAVLLDSSGGYSSFYVGKDLKRIKLTVNLPRYSVVSYKHNLLGYFHVRQILPIDERVMVKGAQSYELECAGAKSLSKKANYYYIDKDNKISICSSSSLIVGKDNVKSFMDGYGKLKTFIIYPVSYTSMRVGISTTDFGSINFNNAVIKCVKNSKLYSRRENFSMSIPQGSEITMEESDGKLKLSVNGITKLFKYRVYLSGSNMRINNIKRGYPVFSPSYDGVLEFYPSGSYFLIINEVSLENYLCKVVPSEMPSYSDIEALKCQAIAARTYAISDMLHSRFASRGFYVDDSTRSQVYNNTHMQTSTNNAVTLTKGMIISYNDSPIDAKYYSTSAGTGVKSSDIWFNPDFSGDNIPYLDTHNYTKVKLPKAGDESGWLKFYKDTSIKAIDSISPYYRWYVIFTPEELQTTLAKSLKSIYKNNRDYMKIYVDGKAVNHLPELQAIKDIKILKRSEGGNVKEISFIFDNAVIDVIEDSNIRGALKSSKIYRYKFNPITRVSSLPSSFFSIQKVEGNFIIFGGGYGHGVGMSQYGAMELAKEGIKCPDILNSYYNGIELKPLY